MRAFSLFDYLRFKTSVREPRTSLPFSSSQGSPPRRWNGGCTTILLALKAGLPAAVADALKEGKRPTNMAPDQEAVYQFCLEMFVRIIW